jgi:predicted phosphodiesterase
VGAAAVLQALRPRLGVLAVSGNNDVPAKWPAQDAPRLSELASEVRLDLPGGELVAVHGDRYMPAARRHARLRAAFAEARCVVYGHTHRLVCDCATQPWILNPGAAGRSRTYGGPSCIVLSAGVQSWDCKPLRFGAP